MTEPIKEGEALEVVHAVPSNIVRMSVSVEEFKKSLIEYQQLKSAIITPDDKQKIGDKEFLKKSYWRKVNNAFNLSVRVVKEDRIELDTGNIIWDFTCEAMAGNGRTSCGVGSCSIYEKAVFIDGRFVTPVKEWKKTSSGKSYKGDKKDADGKIVYEPAIPNSWHNARSTAETRAYNRCVSNLVGGGEVSAEEVDRGEHEEGIDEPVGESFKTPQKKQETTAKVGKPIETKVKEDINAPACTEDQVKTISALVALTPKPIETDKWICDKGVQSYGELTHKQAEDIIQKLEKALENNVGKPDNKDVGKSDTKPKASPDKIISEKQVAMIEKLIKHWKGEAPGKLSLTILSVGGKSLQKMNSYQASKVIEILLAESKSDHEKDKEAKEETK